MDTIDNFFLPPHCAYRDCAQFHAPGENTWFFKCGTHSTKAHGIVQRFKCRLCCRTFSRQTFDLDFCAKKRINWQDICSVVKNCISDRAYARHIQVAPSTVGHKLSRLSKWSQLYHHQQIKDHKLRENVCADGIETFVTSQFYPGHVNLLVGSESQFSYGWDFCFLRRKGRMTDAQKAKRAQIEMTWKIPRGALKKSFQRGVAKPLAKLGSQTILEKVIINTDEHPLYSKALTEDKSLASLFSEGICIHQTVNSKDHRDTNSPLFSVNYMDREIRKDLANHVRETTRHSQEPNMMMDRMTVYLVQHNTEKRFRIKAPKGMGTKHWIIAGIRPETVINPRKGKFRQRPWFTEDFEESFKILWKREIPRPHGTPKRIQANFWMA